MTIASSASAELTLICPSNVHMLSSILIDTQTVNSRTTHNITATCNVTMLVEPLSPSTNYTVSIVYKRTMCSLDHFRTGEFVECFSHVVYLEIISMQHMTHLHLQLL
jgi:hypothetical protein